MPGVMDDSPSSQSLSLELPVKDEPSHMPVSACVGHWSTSEHWLLIAEGKHQSKQHSGYDHVSALEKLEFTVLF